MDAEELHHMLHSYELLQGHPKFSALRQALMNSLSKANADAEASLAPTKQSYDRANDPSITDGTARPSAPTATPGVRRVTVDGLTGPAEKA